MRGILADDKYRRFRNGELIRLGKSEAKELALKIYRDNRDFRRALHFEVYQENANGYKEIQKRTFQNANI